MDIQEKKVFDAYFKEKYPELYKDVFDEDGDDRAIIGYSFAWSAWQTAKAVPESTGLTDVNGKLIFVGDTVEFIGGCRDFLDLSGYGSRKYIVNKGDQMIVRKLKSGYTLSLPWIDCDTPNRIGNLGNYDFWNIHRDFVVIEAQEPTND